MKPKRKTVLFLRILAVAFIAAPAGIAACQTAPRKLPPGVVPGDGKPLIAPRSFIDKPKGGDHALVGFIVRHGDIVDAITPIYRKVENGSLGREVVTKRYGGAGGGETVLKKEGYHVSEIRIKRGMWFNRPEILWIQVVWKRWGFPSDETVLSKRLGVGKYGDRRQPEIKLRAGANKYISALRGMSSQHTSGGTFLHRLAIHSTAAIPNP